MSKRAIAVSGRSRQTTKIGEDSGAQLALMEGENHPERHPIVPPGRPSTTGICVSTHLKEGRP